MPLEECQGAGATRPFFPLWFQLEKWHVADGHQHLHPSLEGLMREEDWILRKEQENVVGSNSQERGRRTGRPHRAAGNVVPA